jgi:hypothetical protein
MPPLSWGHSQFWDGDAEGGGAPVTAGASSDGGYVTWQTSVLVGGGFGVTQVVWEWLVERRAARKSVPRAKE